MQRLLPSLILFLAIACTGNICSAQVYWKDVATIFYENCSACHREGEIGPFPIMSYKDAADPDHVYAIQAYVNSGLMPPWKADPEYSHFLDERILSQAEKDLISDWVDGNALPGDTTLAPPPPTFPVGSQLGIPDIVLSMSEAYEIPGDDSDRYVCFVLPTNFLNDQNISAIEFRPGNAAVVHHAFIYLSDDSSAYYKDLQTPEYGYPSFGGVGDGVSAEFLTLYGPGMTPRFYPPESGVNFKENSFVIAQIHYAPVNYAASDQSSINLFFSTAATVRKVYAKRIGEGYITNPPFVITANERDTFYTAYPVPKDYSLFAIAPHQHLLGESYMIWAVTPGLDSIPLIHIPDWDFHWQLLYSYPFMIKLPEGSSVYTRVSYDNTLLNEDNPNNPPIDVHYGESSEDEMCKYFLNMLDYQAGDEEIILDSNWVTTGIPPVAGIISSPQLYAPSPDPADQEIFISCYFPEQDEATFFIYDLSGKLVFSMKQQVKAGFNQFKVETGSYANGSYFCSMQTSNKRITHQFIIHR